MTKDEIKNKLHEVIQIAPASMARWASCQILGITQEESVSNDDDTLGILTEIKEELTYPLEITRFKQSMEKENPEDVKQAIIELLIDISNEENEENS